eukprot:TRINITY_DN10867_c0_g1_i4.p1 TRINITY_DN10867_c0_g1~~TRINITY_DN10867_c0_g1_i4.p1  ORF type:complete len:262 (-),score=59.67 TRINITY_DN10867_c0_g1_i4:240-1025(-)
MGCCCGSIFFTRFVALTGLLISIAVIVGPAFIFISGAEFPDLMPLMKDIHKMLESEYEEKEMSQKTLIQIRQLLNSVNDNAWIGALVVMILSGCNIFMDILLLVGACCRVRCLFLPWLIFAILEILFLGVPIVIFCSLLGTYLYVEGFLIGSIVCFAAPSTIVFFYLLIWFSVLCGYWNAHKANFNEVDDVSRSCEDQPLISGEHSQGCSAGTSYNLGQYPQYYPPHSAGGGNGGGGGPSAPPQTTPTEKNNPNLYPTLPA